VSPSDPPHNEEQLLTWEHAQAVIAVLAGIAGLGVYVYLLGGIVAWLRTVAARLPADNVTPAFESHVLVAIGVKVLVFELVLLVAVSAVIFTVRGIIRGTERGAGRPGGPSGRSFNRPTADDGEDLLFALTIVFRALLVGLMVAALCSSTGALTAAAWVGLAIVIAVGFAALELTLRWRTSLFRSLTTKGASPRLRLVRCASRIATWAFIVAVVVLGAWRFAAPLGATVLVLLALLVLTHFTRRLRFWTGHKSIFHAGVVVGVMVALNLIIVPYLATPPVAYERATVTTPTGELIEGAYLGRTADGLFLATCEPTAPASTVSRLARVRVIADEEIKELTLGGPRYTFDVGRRPTLLALTEHFLTGDDLHATDDGISLDLRHHRATCIRYAGH
jgi:hypothetical protein